MLKNFYLPHHVVSTVYRGKKIVNEYSKLNPLSEYSKSKVKGEKIVLKRGIKIL